jgi:DNA-binding CsgD family transcriptional regulator/tetratricopeptide (TPR) repeat protein
MVAKQASLGGDGAIRRLLLCLPSFTGREAELTAIQQALAGTPTLVVLVEGEAGIGKTRLVREFLGGRVGGRALLAACLPLRRPATLSPLVDALRQAMASPGGLGLSGLAGALRPLFPEWAADLPAAPEPVDDAAAARHRLFRALAEVLDKLQVAVLVIEDAHWVDEATLEFLLFLAARQGPRPSLVVTYRPEDVPPDSLLLRLSSRMPSAPAGIRLRLEPLTVGETSRLVSSMLDGSPLSPEFAAFLHQRTDGIPLAAEELVRLMHDRADLARRGGEWVRRSLDEIAVPATIRDGVLERTGRLGEEARAMLAAAAVLAHPADERTLRAVASLTARQADAALTELVGSGLLAQDRSGLVSFRHVLAERAVYEAVAAPQRRTMHRRAGQLLERRSPQPIAQLTRHYREASQLAKWRAYAEQAIDLSLAAGDETTATGLMLDLLTEADVPAATVVRLIKKLPYPAFPAARFDDLIRPLRAALHSEELDERDEAEGRLLLGRVLLAMDDREPGRAEVERAIPGLAHDPVEAARAMIHLGCPSATMWPVSRHLEWLQRAAEVAAPLPRADQIELAVDHATALLLLGDESGWDVAAQIPDDGLTVRERRHVANGGLNIGHTAILWGRYPLARRLLARGLELARANGYQMYRDMILASQAHLDFFEGDWDGLAERSGALVAGADIHPLARLEALLVTGLAQAVTGDREQARRSLEQVLATTTEGGMIDEIIEPAAALGRLALASDQAGEALRVTEGPAGIVAGKNIWIWAADLGPARTEALTRAGRIGEAAELHTMFGRALMGKDAPAARAALVQCGAIVAEGRGDVDRAAELFAEAAAAWQALPRPYDALLAAESRARCLLAAGQRDTAAPILSQALTGLSALGARDDAVRVIDTLNQLGVPTRRPWLGGSRGYGDRLSPRELDVVRLIVEGRTNRQIAQNLVLSPKTVANHVDSAMRKLGVSSRTVLAARAVEDGIVSEDQEDQDQAGTGARRRQARRAGPGVGIRAAGIRYSQLPD